MIPVCLFMLGPAPMSLVSKILTHPLKKNLDVFAKEWMVWLGSRDLAFSNLDRGNWVGNSAIWTLNPLPSEEMPNLSKMSTMSHKTTYNISF